MKTLFALLMLIISINCYSSEEDYFGSYISINKNLVISFRLDEEGIKDLKVNNITFDVKTITHDYLGIFGNSQVFQIHFIDKNKFENVIKLFIVTNDGEFIIATGFYMQFTIDNKNKLIVKKKQSVEFKLIKN